MSQSSYKFPVAAGDRLYNTVSREEGEIVDVTDRLVKVAWRGRDCITHGVWYARSQISDALSEALLVSCESDFL